MLIGGLALITDLMFRHASRHFRTAYVGSLRLRYSRCISGDLNEQTAQGKDQGKATKKLHYCMLGRQSQIDK